MLRVLEFTQDSFFETSFLPNFSFIHSFIHSYAHMTAVKCDICHPYFVTCHMWQKYKVDHVIGSITAQVPTRPNKTKWRKICILFGATQHTFPFSCSCLCSVKTSKTVFKSNSHKKQIGSNLFSSGPNWMIWSLLKTEKFRLPTQIFAQLFVLICVFWI